MKAVKTQYGMIRSKHVFEESKGSWVFSIRTFSGKTITGSGTYATKEQATYNLESMILSIMEVK